jgi:hypothetical protein
VERGNDYTLQCHFKPVKIYRENEFKDATDEEKLEWRTLHELCLGSFSSFIFLRYVVVEIVVASPTEHSPATKLRCVEQLDYRVTYREQYFS